jgi:hypothetical protein
MAIANTCQLLRRKTFWIDGGRSDRNHAKQRSVWELLGPFDPLETTNPKTIGVDLPIRAGRRVATALGDSRGSKQDREIHRMRNQFTACDEASSFAG